MNALFERALLARIEDAGLNASAPAQQRWMDGWLVRFSPGTAKRARCINALAPGFLDLGQKLALCKAVVEETGVPLCFRVTPFTQPAGLENELAAEGLEAFGETYVMVSTHLQCLAGLEPNVRVRATAPAAFAELVGGWRGSSAAERRAHADRLLNLPVECRAFVLTDGQDRALACGQFTREAEIVGLYDVFTEPGVRGRGHARTLCRYLLDTARSQGASVAYLQVEAANAPGRQLYAGLGFELAYTYHYRARLRAAPV